MKATISRHRIDLTKKRFLRGSTQRCPKCGSSAVAYDATLQSNGYGPGLALCRNCKTMWEPFDPADVWDQTDPHCSFRSPCNNCAFRPGSSEQEDRTKWKSLIEGLRGGASFYCHKGVPITTDAEHGFSYPKKNITTIVDGEPVDTEVYDTKKLRPCRGYLRALKGLHKMGQLLDRKENDDALSDS
jgi:hypothetical protein